MYSEDSVVIKAELPEVFAVTAEIEKYGDFIPSYKGVKVLSRGDNTMTLKRTARIAGIKMNWTSEAVIKENEAILFDQIGGPLKGMHTEWRLKAVEEGTQVNISHDLTLNIPVIGRVLEKIIYNFIIKDIAHTILINMKEKIESTN